MVVGVGFEPTYATRADLQSAAFNHSATPPKLSVTLIFFCFKACEKKVVLRIKKGQTNCQQ